MFRCHFFQSRYRVFGYQPVPSTDVKPVCLSINLTCGFFHIAGNLAQNNVNTGLGDVSIYYYLLNFFNHEQTSVRPPRNSSACSPGLWTVSTQCAVNLRKKFDHKVVQEVATCRPSLFYVSGFTRATIFCIRWHERLNTWLFICLYAWLDIFQAYFEPFTSRLSQLAGWGMSSALFAVFAKQLLILSAIMKHNDAVYPPHFHYQI